MARIRSTKPDWWTREYVLECSTNARLFYKGMENFADDAGNIESSQITLKCLILPSDNIKVSPLLEELEKTGQLIPYSVNGRNYYHLVYFKEDQKIDRPGKPRCPGYDPSLTQERALVDNSPIRRDGGEGEGKGKGIGKEKDKTIDQLKTVDHGSRGNFEIIWNRYPHKRAKEKAFLKFKNQVKTEQDWVNIQKALSNYITEVEGKRKNSQPDLQWQHGSTWFNNNWRDYIGLVLDPPDPDDWDEVEKRLAKGRGGKDG